MPKIEFGTSEMQPMSTSCADANDDACLHDDANQEYGPRCKIVGSDIETDSLDKRESHRIDVEYGNEACVVSTNIVAITKSQLTSGSSPRYMFVVELNWSDGHTSYIARDHDDFFRYHCWLLDNFRDEAGYAKSARQIPLLPGKKFFRNDLRLAEERKPQLLAYLNDVVKLKRVSQSKQAQAFFKRRPGDPKDNEPLLQNDNSVNDNDVTNIAEKSKLVIDGQQSKGCQRDSSAAAKNTNGEVNGSHDNKTFQPDEEEDDDAIDVVLKTSKDDESQKQNSNIEESVMNETAAL